MPRWLSTALLVALPCLFALVAYDAVAVVLLRRGEDPLVPAHDLARGVLEDVGLALVYAVTIPPRVLGVVSGFVPSARRQCLVMLGLGLAWYDVLCAWLTRFLVEPPGFVVSLVVLFVIPAMLAPWYLRWLKTMVPGSAPVSGPGP